MRLVVDTAVRMFYPFLPEISRGLGITLSQGGLLLALRSAMVFPSPLFGAWSDRHGPRTLLTGCAVDPGAGSVVAEHGPGPGRGHPAHRAAGPGLLGLHSYLAGGRCRARALLPPRPGRGDHRVQLGHHRPGDPAHRRRHDGAERLAGAAAHLFAGAEPGRGAAALSAAPPPAPAAGPCAARLPADGRRSVALPQRPRRHHRQRV